MEGFEIPNQTAFVGLFNFAFAGFAFSVPVGSAIVIDRTGGSQAITAATGIATLAGAVAFWVGTTGTAE